MMVGVTYSDHVASLEIRRLIHTSHCSNFLPPLSLTSSFSDITKLPTRGPCSKYTLDLEEGKFCGVLELTFQGDPFRVSVTS